MTKEGRCSHQSSLTAWLGRVHSWSLYFTHCSEAWGTARSVILPVTILPEYECSGMAPLKQTKKKRATKKKSNLHRDAPADYGLRGRVSSPPTAWQAVWSRVDLGSFRPLLFYDDRFKVPAAAAVMLKRWNSLR